MAGIHFAYIRCCEVGQASSKAFRSLTECAWNWVMVCHWKFSNRNHDYTILYPVLAKICTFATHHYTKLGEILQKYEIYTLSIYQNCKNMQICNPWMYQDLLETLPMSAAHSCTDIYRVFPPPPPPRQAQKSILTSSHGCCVHVRLDTPFMLWLLCGWQAKRNWTIQTQKMEVGMCPLFPPPPQTDPTWITSG